MPKDFTPFVLLLLATNLFAQTPYKAEKWGKISDSDLRMTVYPEDSSASAVVLQDIGNMEVKYEGNEFYVQLDRSRRIKILDVTAFEQGNLKIPYRSGDINEKLFDLDVQIFTPAGAKQKIKPNDIFTERISEKWSAKKIFIPSLEKGSIIEYRYTRRSPHYSSLFDWYFQEDIPVRWSEIQVTLPGYFDYAYLLRAPRKCDLLETRLENDVESGGLHYPANIIRFGLAKLPALRSEPFMTTLDDYLAHIGFQIRAINFPNQRPVSMMTSWTDTAIKLEEHNEFGGQYLKKGNLKSAWDAFSPALQPNENQDSIAEKALRFVSRNIKWNGEYRFWPSSDLDEVFKQKTGNSADINLLLTALLKKAGLNAYPLAISTRNNGAPYPEYPFLEQFNSIAVYCRNGSEAGLLLDAVNPFHALNELSEQHYNKKAWVVDRAKQQWISLIAPESNMTWFFDAYLDASGALRGKCAIKAGGANASIWRAGTQKDGGKSFLKRRFEGVFTDMEIDSVAASDPERFSAPFNLAFSFKTSAAANVAEDFIYVQPVLDYFIHENPFKTPDRRFQVNYAYPLKMQYILHLRIPQGYVVTDMPENQQIALPGNAGKLMFSCRKMNETQLELVLKTEVQKLDFTPEEYPTLRHFYELNIEKIRQQIVLKKS